MASEPHRLKLFWEHFFKAETGTYEKSSWLDLFLAEFIIQLNEGANAKDLIDFCPVSGVVSLVGCELLCGVHRATAAATAHPPPLPAIDAPLTAAPAPAQISEQEKDKQTDGEDGVAGLPPSLSAPGESALRRHLLASAAWRCLVLLRALGVEGLSCCRQLSSVLVWAYGELQGPSEGPPAAAVAPRPPPRPMHTLFSDRIWSTQKNLASQGPKLQSAATPEKHVTLGRWKKLDTPESKTKTKYNKESEISSESAGSGSDLHALSRSLAAPAPASPRDAFQYFDAPASPRAAPAPTAAAAPPRTKAADYTEARHRRVIDARVSAPELALIITDLLAELCRTESSLAGAQGQQISVQCVNFALRNLCALQFASGPARAPPAGTLPLTELLLVALDRVLLHPDLCAKLISQGVLPMLLRLLEDVVCKSKSTFGPKEDSNRAKSDSPKVTESEHLLKFVFGVAYSITAFFHCLLMQCRSLDKLQEFTEQFKLYAECLKGGLLKESVELMIRVPDDSGEGVTLIKRLVDAMGRLVGGMKRVRSDVVHAAACTRARHKACRARLRAGRHHHHPALGAPLAAAAPELGAACCVAVLYGSLTGLLADERVAAEPALRGRLLRVMLDCGACCCFCPAYLVECVVRLVLAHSGAAAAGLRLLERTVYGELGAAVLPQRPDSLPCATCATAAPGPASAVWPFLVHYNSLLQPDNHRGVLQVAVGHLLRVTPRCRPEVKYELLFGVIYPTFIVAKHRYAVRADDAAFFLTAACLNIFAGLLAAAPFAERFVERGGLSYVLELVSLPEFSGQCCAILEMAIVVEIGRLGAGGAGAEALGSVRMLYSALEAATDKCFKVYRLLLGEETFEELCEPVEVARALGVEAGAGWGGALRAGGALEESVEDYLEVVRTAVTFWDTVGCLTWRCAALRAAAGARAAAALALLRASLARVAAMADGGAAQPHALRLHVRLAAALLTVLFALDEQSSGRSVSAGCAALRAAAAARGAAGALCEAALAVPVTHTHSPNTHKLPVLWCASGGSSASGDSARPPPPPPTDAGYEADVEISKLDLSSSLKSRQRSSSESSDSISSGGSEASAARGRARARGARGAACAECGARGEGPRPELCLIVVDILVQLIDRVCPLVAPGSEPAPVSAASAASSAAAVRGVCARLAAARGPLLAPLLAPPVLRLLAMKTTDPHLQEIQRSVLELMERCASRGVEPAPLAALLRLAGGGGPGVGVAGGGVAAPLAAVRRLARAARAAPHTPDWALTFPVQLHDKESQCMEEKESERSGVSCAAGEAWAAALADAHRRDGVVSPWCGCAARLAVEAEWAAWLHGWAVVLWLRTHHHHHEEDDKKRREDNTDESSASPLHVLSVGHDALMLEMWLHAHTGHLEFRLSRAEACSGCAADGVVSSVRSARALPPRRWACVGLNVRDVPRGRKVLVQVTLYVNGCEYETLSLPLQGLLPRKPSRVHVLIGAAEPHTDTGTSTGTGVYHMAALRITRAPLLTPPLALHLAAHGPDYACQVKCEYPNYPVVLTPEVLESDIDWDQVYDLSLASLREFHEAAVLAYSAHAPRRAALHRPAPALSTTMVLSGLRGGVIGGAGVPEPVRVQWAGAPRGSLHRGLAPALLMLGGVDVLLYLFAKVIETGPAVAQAAALSALVSAAGADGRLWAGLLAPRTNAMLLAALHAPRAVLTHHMLKVILDAACSAPVVSGEDPAGGALVVTPGAALLDPRLLLLLLDGFKHAGAQHGEDQELSWELESPGARVSERGCVWALTLRCVAALAHGGLNLRQMARVGLLAHLLTACKERLLGAGSMCAAGAAALAALARALLAAPPPAANLALLTDFLLLLHQASDTFITHSRANFYFLLTADTADSSEYAAPDAKRRTRRARQRPGPGSPAASSSSLTSDGVTSDDVTSELDDRMDNSSVDSAKHLKGLINMQIKEGRKHNISSTSENSDVTAELPASTDVTDAADGELAGYVVVGEPLPAHARYTDRPKKESTSSSSGAGVGAVAGGRAEVCRGLLLLLRDAIATLPDSQLAVSGAWCVSDACLCVLANQRCGAVRAAAVRAAAAAQRRRLLPRAAHYYMHLANQVALYPCTWELAGACAALLTKCDVPLLDQLDPDVWADIGSDAGARSPPLLALLPAALHDPALAQAITSLVATLIDKISLKSLLEVCVGEVLVRTVRGAGLAGAEAEGALATALHDALARLARKALATPHSMQTVVELHHMLTYVEHTSGAGAGAARAARDAQAALYVAELDYLEDKLHSSYTSHTKYVNYFATVLSSAVSLGGGGGEGAARLAGAAARATAFLLTLPPDGDALREAHLFDRLLATLLPAASSSQPPKWWSAGAGGGAGGALWAGPLTELVWWAAGPARAARPLQARLLRALYHAPPPAQRLLTPHDPSALQKLAVYLLSMLKQLHAAAAAGGAACGVELAISDWARGWAVGCQAALADRLPANRLQAEADALLRQDLQRWAKAQYKQRPAIAKVVFSRDALAAKLTEGAMSLTRAAVDAQNAQRKLFMERLRAHQGEAAACAQRWQRLADHFTHEQALWHEPSTYPMSWQLDPTEGPGRVRVRLRRAHLHIPPRFLKPHARYKAERAAAALAAEASAGGWARGRAARLQPHEAVLYMARATHVTVDSETPGELLLTDRSIHFVPESPGGSSFWYRLSALQGASARRWCLQERAAELQPAAAPATLLAFADTAERDAFLKALANCHLPNRVEPDTLTEAMSQWRAGSISNWEYLMRLNSLAGRTYNDLMQYPVLPFVIADYSSRILDLDDPASFRDLSRPMAVQNKSREQHYINTYNDLRAARREGCSPLLARAPHHYASLYSNSGGVLHYLVRLPPFTELFLNYQDNNFDMPDRTFHSLATTWRLITHDSPTDVKELIPELFYLPELFYNNEDLDLGVRQCGADVDAVALPPWAADARLFTLAHRQALEAPAVTDQLPHWIDLVFGYKQTGQAAIDAINVFPACTYYGFEPMSLADEVDRRAAAAMVRTYGQAPRQLLRQPHPHRAPDLRAPLQEQRSVWAGVSGARWGRWAGAPGAGVRAAASVRAPGAARAQPLAPRAAALLPRHTLLLSLQDEAESLSGGGAALVSWGHGDGLVRLWRRKDLTPDLLLHVPALDQITKGVSWGRSEALLGLASGCVLVLHVSADAGGVRVRTEALRAHSAPVTDVHVCAPAALIATASEDGRIVLWDLNKFSYIRTLPNRDMLSVTLLAVSETLADVASVHDPARPGVTPTPAGTGVSSTPSTPTTPDDEDSYEKDAYKYKSLIRVHTCNGRFVGSVKVHELVTCVCYSNAAEGVSVNCVVAGAADGAVTLYCSWDLRPVRRVPPPHGHHAALLSLSYSSDASVLFASYADGWCVAWEGGEGEARAPPRLQWAHTLLPAARR